VVRVAGRVRVDLAGKRIVDDWSDGPLREYRIPVVPELHRNAELRVTYGHEVGDAVIQVGWEINRQWADRGPVNRLERQVYLPAATAWYDFWTGRRLEGGQTIAAPAPFSRIPVFARAGSLLPLGPDKQWQDEVPDDPIEWRIYPGADGRFTLYEDAGDSYDYEKGARSAIDLVWNDGARRLSIGRRRGGFPGMLERRRFHIVLVRSDHGVGIGPTVNPDREILYEGSEVDAGF
jgi:alpha-D-xyloside xylohydrolase